VEQEATEITINGVAYIPKDSMAETAPKIDGMEYCIVCTERGGIFAGYVQLFDDTKRVAVLINSRRIQYWNGAGSISQIAMEGASKPKECRFAMVVPKCTVVGVCSVTPCTQKGVDFGQNEVPVWKK
jgi:hypothetical protein